MQVSYDEIKGIRDLIRQLNADKKSVVIVEGKKDSKALKKLGYMGKILVFHHFNGLTNFTDYVANYENLVMLLDGDRKGRYLTARITEKLERRTSLDFSYKKKLISISKGRVRFIEQLSLYYPFID